MNFLTWIAKEYTGEIIGIIIYIIAIIGIVYIEYRITKRLIKFGINYYLEKKIHYEERKEIDQISQEIIKEKT